MYTGIPIVEYRGKPSIKKYTGVPYSTYNIGAYLVFRYIQGSLHSIQIYAGVLIVEYRGIPSIYMDTVVPIGEYRGIPSIQIYTGVHIVEYRVLPCIQIYTGYRVIHTDWCSIEINIKCVSSKDINYFHLW